MFGGLIKLEQGINIWKMFSTKAELHDSVLGLSANSEKPKWAFLDYNWQLLLEMSNGNYGNQEQKYNSKL